MRQVELARFWLPLYASWLLMMIEGPLVSAAINRLPDEVTMLAALGIVFGLAVFIESPIINLMATATALVNDRQSYRQTRWFVLHWMLLLSAVSAVVACTPLFDWIVRDAMQAPADVAQRVRTGMIIMIPWSAAIAWRRFLQGVLIGAGRSRPIAVGTALRLALSAGCAFSLGVWSGLSGIEVGVYALMVGVVAEALFASLAARPVIRGLSEAASSEPLSYRALLSFHLPLASTSMLTLVAQPLVFVVLTRLDRASVSLAAWSLVFQLTLLVRSAGFALPEMVIALDRDATTARALRRFSLMLAAATFAIMLVFLAEPVADFYLQTLQSATPEVAALARIGVLLLIPLPPAVVMICWLRGRLMQRRETKKVNGAILWRIGVFVPVLAGGLLWGWPGLVTATCALDLSVFAELTYLLLATRRSGREPIAPRASPQTSPAA